MTTPLYEKANEIDPGAFDPALFMKIGTGPAFDRRERAYAAARKALAEDHRRQADAAAAEAAQRRPE